MIGDGQVPWGRRIAIPYDGWRRDYAALDEEGQVEVLRRVALVAAERFGLVVRDLALVLHAYNTTFRLDTDDGRRLALRVNTNSKSTPAHIAAQQAWLHALATETAVRVPDPLAAPGGGWHVEVDVPRVGRPAARDRGVVARRRRRGAVRRGAGARPGSHHGGPARPRRGLHAARRGPTSPCSTSRSSTTTTCSRAPCRCPRATPRWCAESLARCRGRFDEVFAGQRPIVLHADLHGGNLKWHEGRLAVFDLDDAGFGVPALDLAISTFYLRAGDRAVEDAAARRYAEVRDLPDVTDEQFEALVAARQLLLANSLLSSSTASLRADAADYLDVTVARLREWHATGRFTRGVLER